MLPKVYYNNDPTSFAFSTCQKRWPILIQNAIDDITQELEKGDSETQQQGQLIASQLAQLKNDLVNDHAIDFFNEPEVPGLASYDETLSQLPTKITWLTGPWLFLECYLYRRINLFFVKQTRWAHYDIFEKAKRDTFKSSAFGVTELAIRYKQLHDQISESPQSLDTEALRILFTEFIDISLWGNATDLSLLANATLEDIKSVQGAEARKASEQNILTNDLDKAWSQLQKAQDAKRVDFILDNAGFENYADLILSLFLLDSGLAQEIVFHCKTRPWMVSDTMIKDFDLLLTDLKNTDWFPDHRPELDFLHSQLIHYHRSTSQLKLVEHEFWTLDLDYWNISPDETRYGGNEVHSILSQSDLIIVKGDLNYRKLTGDRHWPRDTPFIKGIGPLAHAGLPLLALRTCKADVCLGLPHGKDEELCEYWRSQGNEVGELWCSSGKWAVISYTDGNEAF